ncbi:MAG: hypothetical protein ACI36Z_09805 [Alloprevotella sp.]
MKTKRIAVLRLHLKDGRILQRQILCLNDTDHILSFAPLKHETCLTEWHRSDWYEE